MHGNEPSSREGCLIIARELAFSDDPRTLDILRNMTVLIVPAINGDGRAANTRGNSTGQDLNRDHSLLRQPETFALAEAVRDYTPEVAYDGHEFGNNQAGDLPTLMPRHLNVAESIFSESKSLIENWLYGNGSEDGWWYCPYGCQNGGAVGLSQETILRNTMGLKNTVSMLLEARSAGGQTRPNEAIAANNRRRKTYSAIYTMQQLLDYYRANQPVVSSAIKESIQFQKSNTGRIVFRGSYDVPAFPAPHPGEAPPPDGAAGGHPRPAAVRLPAHRRAVPLAAGRQPLGGRPPGRPRHQGPAARAAWLVRADEAGAAGPDPAAARRRGGRADGRRPAGGLLAERVARRRHAQRGAGGARPHGVASSMRGATIAVPRRRSLAKSPGSRRRLSSAAYRLAAERDLGGEARSATLRRRGLSRRTPGFGW